MKISIVIDCWAWDYLFEKGIDLSVELPPDGFDIFIPREVEIELRAISDVGKDGRSKLAFKKYVRESIESRQVKTNATFGFAEAAGSSGVHRYAGFGHGTFQSEKERQWYAAAATQKHLLGKAPRPSGLTQREADAAVAASSFYSIVLTGDKEKGPIKDALQQGGKIIYLSDFDAQALSLKTYILNNL